MARKKAVVIEKKKKASKSKTKAKTKKTKGKTKSTKKGKKPNNGPLDDAAIVIVDDDLEIDKEKVIEERRAYLEEARSQEAFD